MNQIKKIYKLINVNYVFGPAAPCPSMTAYKVILSTNFFLPTFREISRSIMFESNVPTDRCILKLLTCKRKKNLKKIFFFQKSHILDIKNIVI